MLACSSRAEFLPESRPPGGARRGATGRRLACTRRGPPGRDAYMEVRTAKIYIYVYVYIYLYLKLSVPVSVSTYIYRYRYSPEPDRARPGPHGGNGRRGRRLRPVPRHGAWAGRRSSRGGGARGGEVAAVQAARGRGRGKGGGAAGRPSPGTFPRAIVRTLPVEP